MSIHTFPLPRNAKPVSRHCVPSGISQTIVVFIQSVVPRMVLPPTRLSCASSAKKGPLGRRLGRTYSLIFSDLVHTVMRTVWPRYSSGVRMHWPHHIHEPLG